MGAHLLPIAIPDSAPVSQMELRKDVLLGGILAGFSQAYEILAPVSPKPYILNPQRDPCTGERSGWGGESGAEAQWGWGQEEERCLLYSLLCDAGEGGARGVGAAAGVG
jgi:hypothetical protein